MISANDCIKEKLMIQIQLINNMIELERRLAFEEEKRLANQHGPYVNYLAAPQKMDFEEEKQKTEVVFDKEEEQKAIP